MARGKAMAYDSARVRLDRLIAQGAPVAEV